MVTFWWVVNWLNHWKAPTERMEYVKDFPSTQRALDNVDAMKTHLQTKHTGGQFVLKDNNGLLVAGPWNVLPLLLLVLLASSVNSQTVKLPAEQKGEPGTFVIVSAETDCAELQWVVLDVGLSLIPPALLKDSRTAVVMAGKSGSYRLLAYGAKGDKASVPAICLVVVGDPVPPVPPIPPPPPVDLFVKQLKDAYDLETDPQKATQLLTLSGVYGAGVRYSTDVTITTWGNLFLTMSAFANTQVLSGKLPKVQLVISAKLKSELPTSSTTPLDGAGRKKAETSFNEIIRAIELVRIRERGGF